MENVTPSERIVARGLLRVTLPLLGIFAAFSPSAEGAIDFYRMGKRFFYAQTSDTQPPSPVVGDAGVDLGTSNLSDLTSARVFSTSPALLSPASPFTMTQEVPGSGYWRSSQAYSSIAAMDVDLPPGDIFGYLIEGGDLGNRLALLELPGTNLFAPQVPFFTSNAFSQLNGLDPTESFDLTWNSFVPDASANEVGIFYGIYRVSDGQVAITGGLPATATSYQIPGNTLQSNTQYRVYLDFVNRRNIQNAGFINATSSAAYDLVTELQFTTGSAGSGGTGIPEPATLILVFGGLLFIVTVRSWKRPRVAYMLVVVPTICAARAGAAIDFYRLGKTTIYHQTSNSQPTTPAVIYGGVDMAAQSPGDIGSARVFSTTTMPPSPVPEFVLTEFSPGYWASSQGYASVAEMDTNLPPGDTFGFLIEGGDLGDQLALMPLPSTNLFPLSVPYFTGNAFNQLNGLDPTQPFTLNWNSFDPAAGVNDAPIFYAINRVSDGQSAIAGGLPTSETSYVIPANTLQPNTQYRANINFSSRKNTLDAGFVDALASLLFDSITEIVFTTGAALPGDYNRDDVVDAADYVVWRKTLGQMDVTPYSGADGDGDGDILAADLNVWKANFGTSGSGGASPALAAPEPANIALAMSGLIALVAVHRQWRK